MNLSDTIFHNLVAFNEVSGIAVTIKKQGEILLQKGYGYANIEEKTAVDAKTSIFRIASISKCITA